MSNYSIINFFSKHFNQTGIEIEINGIKGTMFGNDGCFELNEFCDYEFYQIFVSGDTIYHCYYDLNVLNEGEYVDSLDYNSPSCVADVTSSYADVID